MLLSPRAQPVNQAGSWEDWEGGGALPSVLGLYGTFESQEAYTNDITKMPTAPRHGLRDVSVCKSYDPRCLKLKWMLSA